MRRIAKWSSVRSLPLPFVFLPLLAAAAAAGCGSDASNGGQESPDDATHPVADASQTPTPRPPGGGQQEPDGGQQPPGGAQQAPDGATIPRPTDAGSDMRPNDAPDAEGMLDARGGHDPDAVASDSGAPDAGFLEPCDTYESSLTIATRAEAVGFCRDYCSVDGDLTITGVELTNLNALHCLRRVTDELRIAASSLLDAELPNLTSVGSLNEGNADNLQVLSLPSLQRIDEYMLLDDSPVLQTLSLPSLVHVGTDIEISYLYEMEAITLPQLETVGGTIEIDSTGILSELSLASLTSVGGSFYVQGGILQKASLPSVNSISGDVDLSQADGLVEFNAPQLQTVGGFVDFAPTETLAILVLDSLEHVGRYLEVQGLDGLEHLYLPSLKTVSDHVYVRQNQSLVSVDLSGLVDPSESSISILIEDNPSLEDIDLSALSDLNGVLSITGNESLRRVDLPNLKSAEAVSGSFAASFEGIELPSLTTLVRGLSLDLGAQTQLDVSKLVEVGTVMIDSDHLERVDLSSLVTVTGFSTWGMHFGCYGENAIEVVVSSLASVNGPIWLYGPAFEQVSFPALVSVSDEIALNGTAVQSLDLVALESAAGLLIEGNPSLTSISAPLLTSITGLGAREGLQILDNPALESVSLPELVSATNIRFVDGPSLGAFALPKTESTGELYFENTGLTSISLPSAQTTDGRLIFQHNSRLTTISLPQLLDSNTRGGVRFEAMPALTTIDVGNLSNAYSLGLLDLDSITNLDPFANMTTVSDWLSIRDNALLDDITGLHNVTSVGDVNVTDNPNLSSQAVDDLIDAIGTENISGTITVSGNGP